MQQTGTFIVIEGTDGSGKGTQFKLLADTLRAEGYQVETFDFPQYDQPSSYFIRQYLNGEYGGLGDVGPYTSSLFYALDRFEAAPKIRKALSEGKVVLANRFTGSNMAHQGTKFNNPEERRGFFIWLDNLEFEMLRIPRPTISLILRVPAPIAQQLVDQKAERSYTEKKRDIHEADLNHLAQSVAVYEDLANLFPKDFKRIDCVRGEQLMSVETIQQLVRQNIEAYLVPAIRLPQPTSDKIAAATIESEPNVTETAVAPSPPTLVAKNDDGQFEITEEGKHYLLETVTSLDGDVYSFTDKLSPITIAAAMARLSRRGDDMRITILDEFASKAGKDSKLLQRVITAYGDDSVQQLAGIHMVVENASNLLTKKLEWGRLAAYLEQSTRYIYFDQKNKQGNYKYYTPEHLAPAVKAQYREKMDALFDRYAEMVHGITAYISDTSATPAAERDGAWKSAIRAQACDAVRPVLPVATQSTVGIFASGQALESLIMHLLSDELKEAQRTGQSLLEQARKVMPTFLERADKPDRGGASIAYRSNTYKAMREVTNTYLAEQYSEPTEAVQLTDVWPRNELDLIPDMLYEHSNVPLQKIRESVFRWPYDRKLEVFESYMGERLNRRHRPGRALEKAHYSWDILCDYGIFRDLQRHRMVDDLEWQMLTPRYGYEVPQLVDEAGYTEHFQDCFDISLELHSLLEAKGYRLEAQYATLLGHRMRWKMTYNAREAFHFNELRTSPQGHPGYRKLVQQMHEKLCEVHPLLGAAMKFVNQGEDAELTRLAAERYTQFKLSQLESQPDKT